MLCRFSDAFREEEMGIKIRFPEEHHAAPQV
jgi:hypothetical protein